MIGIILPLRLKISYLTNNYKYYEEQDTNMKEILKYFNDTGYQSFIVGGTVRDILMGNSPHDGDIATDANPEQIIDLAIFHNIKWIPTGIDHGTISLIFNNEEIQITTFRIDKNEDGRHTDVAWTKDLYVDLSRRDFTINAMAMDINGNIFDPFRGKNDIQNKIIRTVGNPIHRFIGDGKNKGDRHRTMRAIRLATTLDFKIDYLTWTAIKKVNINELDEDGNRIISHERIHDELVKILQSPNRVNGFKLLDESGLLKQIIPEIEDMKELAAGDKIHHPEKDIFIHTIAALSHLDKDASIELILATILHDIGKPPTWNNYHFHGHDEIGTKMSEEILRRLKFPLYIIENVKWLVLNHMRIHEFNKMRNAKKIRLIEEPLFEELLDLLRADIMVVKDKSIITDICNFRENYKKKSKPVTKLINGHDVMAFGIPASPMIAEILTSIEDLVLEGEIVTRDDALEFIENMIKINGMCGC